MLEETPVNNLSNLFGADLDSNIITKFRKCTIRKLSYSLPSIPHISKEQIRTRKKQCDHKLKTEAAKQKLSVAANVKTDWHTLANSTSPDKFHCRSLLEIFPFE